MAVRVAHVSACQACPRNYYSPAGSSTVTNWTLYTYLNNSDGCCDNAGRMGLLVTGWLLLAVVLSMAVCYVRYQTVSVRIRILIPMFIIFMGALVFIIFAMTICVIPVTLIIFTIVAVVSNLSDICYV